MRAGNMTVGFDFCNLENLKIVNGYEVIKKEEQLSNPSSPEDNCTDDQDHDKAQPKTQNSTKQKCGRPANPVPRHKRDSHIKAEYKRRDKIQKGLETLTTLVPELRGTSSAKESKSSLLFKTAEYIHRLKAQCEVQNEAAALRQELEALGTEIHALQDKLPENGLPIVEKPLHHMDMLYDEYVRDETKKDWKFWIFSFFMRPLFKSYREVTYGSTTPLQFVPAVNQWLQEKLALVNLRKGFLDTLRKISTQTCIMTNPEQLRQEAMSVAHHMTPMCVDPPPSPATSTPAVKPPLLTPPLTPPNVALEKPRPKGRRSRSITPPSGDVKPRKRSGTRSENPCSSLEESNQPKKFSVRNTSMPLQQIVVSTQLNLPSTFTQPSVPVVFCRQPVSRGTTMSLPANPMPVSSTAMETDSGVAAILSNIANIANNKLVTTLVESLITAMPLAVASLANTPISLEGFTTASTASCADVTCSTLPANTQTLMSSSLSSANDSHLNGVYDATSIHMEVQTTPPLQSLNTVQSFLPIDHSLSIANGNIVSFDQAPISAGNFDTPMISDIPLLPAVASSSAAPFQTTEEFIDDLCAFSTAQTLPTFTVESSCSTLDVDRSVKSLPFPMNLSEDSLDKMLSLDVTDISSLMTFLNQDDSNIDQATDDSHL